MNRQRWFLVLGLVALLLVVGVTVVVRVGLKRRAEGTTPREWLDPGQPAEGVASQLSTITAAQSLAANGCWPMSAPCTGRGAGLKTMRTYPGHLTDHPNSLIHGLGAGVSVTIGE